VVEKFKIFEDCANGINDFGFSRYYLNIDGEAFRESKRMKYSGKEEGADDDDEGGCNLIMKRLKEEGVDLHVSFAATNADAEEKDDGEYDADAEEYV
jgi:hypothetical protein